MATTRRNVWTLGSDWADPILWYARGVKAMKARDLMQKGGGAWKPEEARALSLSLIALLVNTRREGLDLSQELERFALSM